MKIICLLIIFLSVASCLLPPKFHWKVIEFAWDSATREAAIASGDYIPESNVPSGVARWNDKVFITIPRWKRGVPASLNYINLNGKQTQALTPYPTWRDAFLPDNACCINSSATVVSAFRVDVDSMDRLWVADNGVVNMAGAPKQVAKPAVVVFDLNTDELIRRYTLPSKVLKETSVLSSIVVEVTPKKDCKCNETDAFAYITDMGSNALIVYSFSDNKAWRVEHPFFSFDPLAARYRVGGVEFYWNDGISSATLSHRRKNGYRDLYLHPTSSTKQFKISTELLRPNVSREEVFGGVQLVGDRGRNSQATSCAYDPNTQVLFYSQLSKNGVACWNTRMPYYKDNVPCILSDCNMLEFPNDVKVDDEGYLWILSNRLSRFLYESMDFKEINFRVLVAPVKEIIKGTACDKSKSYSFLRRSKSTNSAKNKKNKL